MFSPSFTHHGGAGGVTGSCHRLTWAPGASLLVDCGLFQGEDASADSLTQHQVDFSLDDLRALIVTHIHIDHIGRPHFIRRNRIDVYRLSLKCPVVLDRYRSIAHQ